MPEGTSKLSPAISGHPFTHTIAHEPAVVDGTSHSICVRWDLRCMHGGINDLPMAKGPGLEQVHLVNLCGWRSSALLGRGLCVCYVSVLVHLK